MDDNEEQRWFSGGFATADPQPSHPRPSSSSSRVTLVALQSLYSKHTQYICSSSIRAVQSICAALSLSTIVTLVALFPLAAAFLCGRLLCCRLDA